MSRRGRWHRDWRKIREVRRRLVSEFGGRCGVCGYERCMSALEFHHMEPAEKRFALSGPALLRPWRFVIEEARKCVLLCANCHRELHDSL